MTSLLLAFAFGGVNQAGAAQPICTNVATSFSPSNPVSAGTTANVTGTVTQAGAVNGCAGGSAGTAVTVGTTTELENEINGVGVPCGKGICSGVGGPPDGSVCQNSSECNPQAGGHCDHATLTTIGAGTPDGNGQVVVPLDTTGLDNQTIGFEASYVGTSVGLKNNNSPCVDKRNDVILWNIGGMTPGESENLVVKVCGTTAKLNCPATPPLTEYLTGAWSTTYGHSVSGVMTYDKSDYTGRVSIDTTCPLN